MAFALHQATGSCQVHDDTGALDRLVKTAFIAGFTAAFNESALLLKQISEKGQEENLWILS